MSEDLDPLNMLMKIMNDPTHPADLRLKAAAVLMPYFHKPLSPIEPEKDNA
ncbi:MAG: hypothetical protein RR429_03345 [Hafnia sp.]